MTQLYIPLHVPPPNCAEPALWFAFRNAELLLRAGPANHPLPWCKDLTEQGLEAQRRQYLGVYDGKPHSLMIAFTAEYAGGELRPDGVEIQEARWFDADDLPKLPPGISISRRLIDTIAAELAGKGE